MRVGYGSHGGWGILPTADIARGSLFEDIVPLWRSYAQDHAPTWGADDPLHDLVAEVTERLTQVDIVLDYVQSALEKSGLYRSPEERQRVAAWSLENKPKVDSGEMTIEEFMSGLPSPGAADVKVRLRAGDELSLFTEVFYWVANRLVEILDQRDPAFALPGFGRFRSPGVEAVRHQLIEHPEKTSRNFARHMVITDAGPVLKSSTIIFRGESGRADPADESVDRGLLVNAQELHDGLLERLQTMPRSPA